MHKNVASQQLAKQPDRLLLPATPYSPDLARTALHSHLLEAQHSSVFGRVALHIKPGGRMKGREMNKSTGIAVVPQTPQIERGEGLETDHVRTLTPYILARSVNIAAVCHHKLRQEEKPREEYMEIRGTERLVGAYINGD